MRRLTKSEKRLLVLFGLVLFGMVNFYGVSSLIDAINGVNQEMAQLRSTSVTNRGWLRDKDTWLVRKQWIDQRQPRVERGEVPQSQLLQALVASAASHRLTIEEQNFGESSRTANYTSVVVKMRLSGNLEDVVRWLTELQQPDKFQAVLNFSLKSTDQPPKMTLELQVARWYSPNVAAGGSLNQVIHG